MKKNKNLQVVIDSTTKKDLEKLLTDKQKVFCYEYLKDFNATSAAKRSGYSERTSYSIGQENLKKPEIEKYIEILKNERSERTKIDQDWVVNKIVDIVEKCMQHAQVLDHDGNPVMTQTQNGQLAAAYIFDSRGALKGLELLGQHVGLKKHEDQTPIGGIEISLNNYLGQPNNSYFPVTPETEHLAKLLGVNVTKK